MSKSSKPYLHEILRRNFYKTFLAGTIAAMLATGSNNAWSSCNRDIRELCDGYNQEHYSSAAKCEDDRQYRESECLYNYYRCNHTLQECLNIFNSCRNSSHDQEKRCVKDT